MTQIYLHGNLPTQGTYVEVRLRYYYKLLSPLDGG